MLNLPHRLPNRSAHCVSRLALVGLLCSLAAWPSTAARAGWELVPDILESLQQPTFPDRDFPITDFGAVADGRTDCRPAVARAIQACHEAGGGRVVAPAGTWYVKGPLQLKSRVNLHLQSDATLRFSTDPRDYLPAVLTRFEGTEVMNFSPPIYAYEQENIALTGKGTLDGQASDENWWRWKSSGSKDVAKLCSLAEEAIPPTERVFGEGHQLRPNFVQPYRCRQVLIEGITIVNSPMWVMHPVLCQGVTVRGVRVDSHGPNNDGCNPESCRNVLIEDCTFDTGDDCIAIKSGRNADGRRLATPSQRIIVRNCTMKDGHGGVVLGSEMSGGIRDIFVENCHMDSPNLERAIRLKSNSLRGGFLERLYVRNIQVGEVSDAVLRINLQYASDRGEHYPQVAHIFLENVTSQKSKYPLYLLGLKERPIEDVVLKNCTFQNASRPSVIEYVDKLTLENYHQPAK